MHYYFQVSIKLKVILRGQNNSKYCSWALLTSEHWPWCYPTILWHKRSVFHLSHTGFDTPLPIGQHLVVPECWYLNTSWTFPCQSAATGDGCYDAKTRPPSTDHGVRGEVWPTKMHGLHPTETRLSWQNSWCGHFECQQDDCRNFLTEWRLVRISKNLRPLLTL